MTPDFTEGADLFQVNIIKTSSFFKYPVCSILDIFLATYKVAKQRPLAFIFFEVTFDQQYLKFIFIKAEYYTINGDGDLHMLIKFLQPRVNVFLLRDRACTTSRSGENSAKTHCQKEMDESSGKFEEGTPEKLD